MTWPMVPLGDVLTSSRSGYWGDAPGSRGMNALAVRNGDISAGLVDWTRVPTRSVTRPEYERARIKSGDILLTTSGDVGKTALVTEVPSEAIATNFVRILRVDANQVLPEYLAHWLGSPSFAAAIAPFTRGTTMQNLSVVAVETAVRVPLPPLLEQRRIAAILDRTARVVHRANTATRLLGKDWPAVVLHGLPLEKFPEGKLGAGMDSVLIGLDRRASDRGPERGHEYVTMDWITSDGVLAPRWGIRVDATLREAEKYEVRDGDLLVNTRNSRELVGKSAVYRGDPALFNNNVARIRFIGALNAECVHAWLWTRKGRTQLEARKSGTTSVYAMYMKDFATIGIPYPDANVLPLVSARKAEVDACLRRLNERRAIAESLLSALRDRAFKGEL